MRLFSDNLLGDTLLQSPAIRSWKKANPDKQLDYYCNSEKGSHLLLQGNPYIDRLLVDSQESVTADHNPFIQMDAGIAFTLGVNNQKSLAWGYGHMLGCEIDSLVYDYVMTLEEEARGKTLLSSFGERVVIVGRHSASCTSNDPGVRVANKCVTNRLWVQVAKWLQTQGYTPLAVGSDKDLQDTRYNEWIGNKAYGLPLRAVAAMTRHAVAVLTVDNGLRHLTAAAGGNLFCISGRIPLWLIHCEPVREGQKIYEEYRELPMVTSQTLIEGAKKVL